MNTCHAMCHLKTYAVTISQGDSQRPAGRYFLDKQEENKDTILYVFYGKIFIGDFSRFLRTKGLIFKRICILTLALTDTNIQEGNKWPNAFLNAQFKSINIY